MGYTHYLYQLQDCSNDKWNEVFDAVELLIDNSPYGLEFQIDKRLGTILLNGIGDEAHEDFVLTKLKRKPLSQFEIDNSLTFYCYKTVRKPYDLITCAILAVVEQIAPDSYVVKSDGNSEDWAPSVQYATSTLQRRVELPVSIKRKKSIAKPRRSVRRTSEYKEFDKWFSEFEDYNLRSERFEDDFNYLSRQERSLILDWLEAAFQAGSKR